MTGWTTEVPGAGDTTGVRSTGALLDSLTMHLMSVHEHVGLQAARIADPVWSGQAASAWQGTVTGFRADVHRMAEAVAPAATALALYAFTVEQIAQDGSWVRRRREDAQHDLDSALRLLAQDPVLGADNRARYAAHRRARDDAQDDLTRADADLAALAERRRTADAQVVAVLDGLTPVAGWQAVGHVAAAAGLFSPEQIALNDAAVLAAAARAALATGDPADLDTLATLLTREPWASDPVTMGALLRQIGPEGVDDLLQRMGDLAFSGEVADTRALDWATALQHALSVGTALWTAEESRGFVGGLSFTALGFAFGDADGAPMGLGFTIAAADRLDALERVEGMPWTALPVGGGAGLLARLQHPDQVDRAADPMSAVLETLGHYPVAALGWLLDGADSEQAPRVTYWFGERDWPHDGFLGVSALWEGVQRLPGGPLDSIGYDARAWIDLASANTFIMAALCSNDAAVTERFSERAQVEVGLTIAAMLPLLSYCVRDETVGEQPVLIKVVFLTGEDGVPIGQDRSVPAVLRDSLARLIGLAGSSAAGAAAVAAGVQHTQQALIDIALLNPAVDRGLIFETIADLQAIFDGAVGGSVEGVLARAREEAAELAELIGEGISMLPVPGVGRGAAAAKAGLTETLGERFAAWAADEAVGRVAGAVRQPVIEAIGTALEADADADALAGTWRASAAAATAGGPGTEESLQDTLSAWVWLLDPEKSTLTSMYHGNMADYLGGLTDDYASNRRDASRAAAQDG